MPWIGASLHASSEPTEPHMMQESTDPLAPRGFDLQGHRGARGLMPENTMAAFEKALELGVTTLEMDVVVTKDSQVVVSHEPWMSSTICSLPSGKPIPPSEGRTYNIYDMTYAEVKQFDCGQRGHPDFPEQQAMAAHKPLLRDVIDMAETYMAREQRAPVFYNIETKSLPSSDGKYHPPPETFANLVYDVLDETSVQVRSTLQSFDGRTLQVAEKEDWPIRLALLVGPGDDNGVRENLDRLGFRPDIYSPSHRLVDRKLVIQAHGWGMDVIPWTVNDPDTMRRLKELGVDGLITDYPNRAQFLVEDK